MNPKTFNDAVRKLALEVAEVVIKKQRDYGKDNILKSPVGAELGIIVRLGDKINRLGNLYTKHQNPENEPIDDSWRDIIGYSLVALMVRNKTFELPME